VWSGVSFAPAHLSSLSQISNFPFNTKFEFKFDSNLKTRNEKNDTRDDVFDVRTFPSDLRSFREALTLLASLRRSYLDDGGDGDGDGDGVAAAV